ncbi:MAG: amidohydrolase family protein, partial [Candidatus Hinthialibacter sp.]
MKTILHGAILLVSLTLLSLPTYAAADQADVIFTQGKILTVDAAFSIHSCMAVKDGRILDVGNRKAMDKYRGESTQMVDLQGKTVMPGIIDSHGHPASACLTEYHHPIPDMETTQDVLNYIRSRVDELEDGEWIWVSQVFLTRLHEERYPTREELDAAAPNNPTVFRTGPDASVNSLALELSG